MHAWNTRANSDPHESFPEGLGSSRRMHAISLTKERGAGVCVYNQSQGIFTTVANLPAAVSVPVSLQQLGADIRCWHSALEGQLIGLRRKVSVRWAWSLAFFRRVSTTWSAYACARMLLHNLTEIQLYRLPHPAMHT